MELPPTLLLHAEAQSPGGGHAFYLVVEAGGS